ncbi:MAG: carboxypeptidase regulatory-like domain-containing protein [Acidobacteria bacterium]|nr:MAG: carboxypeptidase regulatory-like domain-containing protein [Acidobacteriota bacterium]
MRKFVVVFVGIFLLCSVVNAQQTQTGSISGTIMADGQPMPGVTVQATSDVLPKARVAISSGNGQYRFAVLPPGTYELTFTMPGMATEKRSLPVHLQAHAMIDITMKTAELAGEITVIAENPTIDIESAEIKVAIPDEVIEALPVGQEYRDLIKLIPGVQYSEDTVRGPSAGGSGQDNVYQFDGVEVNLPMYGTLSTQPSSHDIEQVAVVKGGANAIGFNRAGGMLINTLSKSGTNRFRGEVSYQFQNDSMTGALDTESEATYEPDQDWLVANLGGPLVPGMLNFYVSYYRPTVARENRANLYGEVPNFDSTRDEYFGKLSWTPTESMMFHGSYRDSTTDQSGLGVTDDTKAGSTSYGDDASLSIAVVEGTWVVNDNSLISFKYSNFSNDSGSRPDNIFDFDIAIDGSVDLDVNNLDQQGLFMVPQELEGEDDYNAFIAPLIDQYGFMDSGVATGGGLVGGGSTFNDQDFGNESTQVGYDYFFGQSVQHSLHLGYQDSSAEEDLSRTSNGWGYITAIGGRDETEAGEQIFYRARFQQMSLNDVDPIHSEFKSQNIEINDVIKVNKWTFNLGLVMSNDEMYGQGLKKAEGTVSGFELAPGNMYLMKEIDFSDTVSPRLGVTWSPNGKDSVYASYARYYPAASSLPRAASWARNLRKEIDANFDADGNLLEVADLRSSSGKVFQEGIDPRSIDEYIVGYSKQISNAWTARVHFRHRKGQDFWEDTNNTARSRYDAPEPISHDDYVPNLDEIRAEIGGSSYVIAELDGAFTKYYEVNTEAEWRGENAFFRASYVWSHYYGNFDQDNSTTSNDANTFIGSSFIADGAGRQLWNMRYGDLRGDRRHQVKAYGFYQTDWRGTFGAYAVYQSGQPWEAWDVEVYRQYTGSSSDTSRYAEPAGSHTTDDHYQLDLSYTQDFPLGNRFNLQLRGDVFNVTDNQTGYNIQNKVNSADFGVPRSYFNPRRFQLAVRLQF